MDTSVCGRDGAIAAFVLGVFGDGLACDPSGVGDISGLAVPSLKEQVFRPLFASPSLGPHSSARARERPPQSECGRKRTQRGANCARDGKLSPVVTTSLATLLPGRHPPECLFRGTAAVAHPLAPDISWHWYNDCLPFLAVHERSRKHTKSSNLRT